MHSIPTRLLVLVFSIALSAGVFTAPASATSSSAPQPPSAVTSVLVSGGVKVTWAPSPFASPPIITGPLSISPMVQAVNAYGFSTNAAGNAITVPNRATPGCRNVQFLGFSGFHSAIESSSSSIGPAGLTTALASDRTTVKSTFTVSVGDNIGGATVISSEFGDPPTIEGLNP